MSSQRSEEARWLEGDHPLAYEDHLRLMDEERVTGCTASREAVIEHGDTACPLCERPASAHRSEVR